jgi:hypothetical protein
VSQQFKPTALLDDGLPRRVIAKFIGPDGVTLWNGVQAAVVMHYGRDVMKEVRNSVS